MKTLRDVWCEAIQQYEPDALSDENLAKIQAEFDKIPSKGGAGITRSDLLVINKIDLAPYVGASLEKMDTDARRMRGDRPFVMTNLKKSDGLGKIIGFIETKGGLAASTKAGAV